MNDNMKTSGFQWLLEKWFAVAVSAEGQKTNMSMLMDLLKNDLLDGTPYPTLAENIRWWTVTLIDDIS